MHTEIIDNPRVLAATIPPDRCVPGQINGIRLHGRCTKGRWAQPHGLLWSRWVLSRTDAALDPEAVMDDQLLRSAGYYADCLFGQDPVFSPSAVGGWGDLETLFEFAQDQAPGSDPRTRCGLTCVSAVDPAWWPSDAGLLDHLFLLFGLVEARSPLFFRERQSLQPSIPFLHPRAWARGAARFIGLVLSPEATAR